MQRLAANILAVIRKPVKELCNCWPVLRGRLDWCVAVGLQLPVSNIDVKVHFVVLAKFLILYPPLLLEKTLNTKKHSAI
jgi:hypothetical protein